MSIVPTLIIKLKAELNEEQRTTAIREISGLSGIYNVSAIGRQDKQPSKELMATYDGSIITVGRLWLRKDVSSARPLP